MARRASADARAALPSRRRARRETILLSLVVLAAAVLWAWAGRWYGDEGWYLYCGKIAFEGKVPYRDFLYTQLPLVLYLYGAVARFITPDIFAARAVSVLLTWGTALLTIGLARRLYGRRGALVTTLLFATAWYPVYHLVIVKGYAAGALCLVAAVCLLLRADRGPVAPIAAGVLFAGATLVRTSSGLLLVIACAWEALVAHRWRRALLIGAAGAATVGAALAPFALLDFRDFWFGAFRYHKVSWFHDETPLPDFVRYFTPYLAIAAAAAGTAAWCDGWRGLRRVFWRRPSTALLGLLVGAMTLAHLVVGARAAEYHTLQAPLAFVWLSGISLAALRLALRRGTTLLRAVLFATLVGAAVAGPILWRSGTWLTGLWHPEPAPELARVIQRESAPDEPLLTLNPELCLFSQREGFPGTEMGIFGIMHDYREGTWRPAGSFTEEDFLDLVARGVPRIVALREGDLRLMDFASRKRSNRTDFIPRLGARLRAGYALEYVSPERTGRISRHSYQVWVRR